MIEDKAREILSESKDKPRLWTHAILMAQPAFATVGFAVVEREIVQIGDERLERAIMEKAV